MLYRFLDDVSRPFASLEGTVVGVGITAYPRIIPSFFIHPYHIIAVRKTRDIPLIRKHAEVFCLDEETGAPTGLDNSFQLLSHPHVKSFLKTKPGPIYLLLYQSYPELEELARQEGWTILANPAELRMQAADRTFFEDMMEELPVNRVPGRFHPLGEIHSRRYNDWVLETGPRFVVQLPEVHQGGGRGTFFIGSAEDYRKLRQRLEQGMWRGATIRRIYVRPFIEGTPVSLAMCVTGQGILMSGLQRQLIDLPYCRGLEEDGVFCGHTWGEGDWPVSLREAAKTQGRAIGAYLADLGYKGILGIDFIIDSEGEKVIPIELNPRLTGAFPVLSQIHLKQGLIPMEAFHILEFLGIPYEMDVEELNTQYSGSMRGSHLLLFHPDGIKAKPSEGPGPGVYGLDPKTGDMSLVTEDCDFKEIRGKRQFMLVDGPPEGPAPQKDPLFRWCRLLFSHPVADTQGRLSPETMLCVNRVLDGVFQQVKEDY